MTMSGEGRLEKRYRCHLLLAGVPDVMPELHVVRANPLIHVCPLFRMECIARIIFYDVGLPMIKDLLEESLWFDRRSFLCRTTW